MISADNVARIADWRMKARAGTLTPEEMREAIQVLRADRVAASAASNKAKSTAGATRAKGKIDTDALLSELDD